LSTDNRLTRTMNRQMARKLQQHLSSLSGAAAALPRRLLPLRADPRLDERVERSGAVETTNETPFLTEVRWRELVDDIVELERTGAGGVEVGLHFLTDGADSACTAATSAAAGKARGCELVDDIVERGSAASR